MKNYIILIASVLPTFMMACYSGSESQEDKTADSIKSMSADSALKDTTNQLNKRNNIMHDSLSNAPRMPQ